MHVKIHELAANEFNDAIEWYELQSNSMDERFKNAVVTQIEKIKTHPTWYLIEDDKIYKAYVPKFPFKILYTFDNNIITIWAIAHMHRKPWYWQHRLC